MEKWTQISTDESINPKKKKVVKAEDEEHQCKYVFLRGNRKDERCDDKIKEDGYCVKHLKQVEKKKGKEDSEDDEEKEGHCKHVFLKGAHKDEKCGKKTSSGDYCSVHKKKKDENEKDVKKKDVKKKDENEEKKAYRIKEGDLKGLFILPREKNYVFDRDSKIVKGYEKDGELVDLDDEDIEIISKYNNILKLDEKYKKKEEDDEEESGYEDGNRLKNKELRVDPKNKKKNDEEVEEEEVDEEEE